MSRVGLCCAFPAGCWRKWMFAAFPFILSDAIKLPNQQAPLLCAGPEPLAEGLGRVYMGIENNKQTNNLAWRSQAMLGTPVEKLDGSLLTGQFGLGSWDNNRSNPIVLWLALRGVIQQSPPPIWLVLKTGMWQVWLGSTDPCKLAHYDFVWNLKLPTPAIL